MKRLIPITLCVFCLIFSSPLFASDPSMTLWFDHPAIDWEKEALPIGNGAMGAVFMGGVEKEVLQFNEKTLWEGGPGSKANYDFGHPDDDVDYLNRLAKIQEELQRKGELKPEYVAARLGREVKGYGNYQNFGELVVIFDHKNARNYRRSLDISTALGKVAYSSGDLEYTREYFVSYPDQVIGLRLKASKPGAMNVTIGLNPSSGRSVKREVAKNAITVSGEQEENSLYYEAQVRVHNTGGSLTTQGQTILVEKADEVLILLAVGTNYAQSYPAYRGELPSKRLNKTLDRAGKKTADELIADHVADHQALFKRVSLDLRGALPDKPVNLLQKEYKGKGKQDRALENLYFQFGRYLLIASSRPGSLPANLQGVWNNSNTPPWNADYHVNINVQMNYWPADVTNISETNEPLFDFIDSLIEPGSLAAQKILGVNSGWTLFLNTNIYGFTGVIKWPTAFWQPEAGAWLAQHYYEHYLFTRDEKFLKKRAYPAIKGAAEVWLQALVEDKRDGLLVVNPSYSPEHGGFTVGAAMSQQIVFDVLRNAHEAALILKDQAFANRVKQTLDKLDPGTRIGRWGQLQEWKIDIDDPRSDHRHISHLYALHPGRQISPIASPELAEAARLSLDARGDAGTGWSKAWKVNLWARLLNGDRAHKLLTEQLIHSTLPNLWDNHPPFQIDGNFGATAGIAEMLLQSHNNELHLLPALPDAWSGGRVQGLKARGNIEVDIAWDEGKFVIATLRPAHSGEVQVRLDALPANLTVVTKGDPVESSREGNVLHFEVKGGRTYSLYLRK